MKEKLYKTERDVLFVHLLFIVFCLIMILIPFGIAMGIKLFVLVLIYSILILIIGIWRKYKEWLNIWLFVFIISIFQILPDWFLSAELEILVFPEDGLFKIGTVSGYMAGLWVIPLFIITFTGNRFQERYSIKISYLIVAVLSLLIFGITESTIWMLESWYAQNVIMVGHLALYIIVPEIILGLSTYYGFELVQEKNHFYKILIAFIVMLLYLGNVVFFYFLIEHIIF